MSKSKKTVLVVAAILAACLPPLLIGNEPYIIHIFIMSFYIGTVSMAWNILGGMAGQLSLGHATFMGLGAYTTAVLLIKVDVSPWIGMAISFFGVGLIAAIIFYPCFILRGPYFTLATIAFGETFRNLLMNWPYVGQGQGLLMPFGGDDFLAMRFLSKIPYYYMSLAMLVLVSLAIWRLDRSKWGYAFKTIREDEDTANAIGINTTLYKLYAAFLSAGLSAVAGAFYSQYLRFIDPEIMMTVFSVEFVLPAIIGGVSFVGGPLIGAILIIPLSEFLRAHFAGTVSGINIIVYAVILILVIFLKPSGLLGWHQEWSANRKRKKPAAPDPGGEAHAQG
ncbi:MAG: branched-chain amino acid ABC transporter permease [Planctomycetota bacterium]|jgi:branched-chain amino acid transport system permease protein|nr:branched-chain amino acid ABC transporter permease [Planctomycetota bacterium]